MAQQRSTNIHFYDFMPFFALTCWTYIFLVSAIQPRNPWATFVLCVGAILLAGLALWLEHQLRSPYEKHAAIFGLQDGEEVQPPGWPSTHESASENSIAERMPLLKLRTTGDIHALGKWATVAREQIPSIPSEAANPLGAVHEMLLRIRQRNKETIARLAETQALFEEHREKTRLLRAELAKTRVGMLLSPLQNSSHLQQRLRPTGRGMGDLWGTGEV